MHILRQSELDGMPCPDTLIHADCLEAMKHIADGSVSAIIADLPYQITNCAWDTLIPFEPLWEAYKRVIKPGGAIVLTAAQPFTSALVMSNPQWFRYALVWDKVNLNTGALNANRMPMRRHEDICVFYRSLPTYNPQWQDRPPLTNAKKSGHGAHTQYGNGGSHRRCAVRDVTHPCSVIAIPGHQGSHSLHPTQKPVALFEYLIRTYTNPGDLVLDNCMGSGTLPVACLNTGRHFIGIEKDDTYFAASVERVKAALAQQAFAFDAPPV